MAKKVKLSDIAKVLGVSNVTVSKALSNKDGVSDALRKKIRQVAREMGYINQNNYDSHNQTIAVLIAQQFLTGDYSFYWNLYKYVVEELKSYHHYALLEILEENDEKNNRIPEFVEYKKVDGIIVLGKLTTDYLQVLKEYHLPMILLDSHDLNVDISSVNADNVNDFYLLTEYLVQKGYKDIGFVGSVEATSGVQDRYLGYYKSLLSHNRDVKQEWIVEDREELLFKEEFTLPSQMPEAFVCSCDQSAYYFMRYLQKKGYQIPQDVAIVGYYDFVYSRLCIPALTTIHVDLQAMAIDGIKALMNAISGDEMIHHIVVKGELIERNTVNKDNSNMD